MRTFYKQHRDARGVVDWKIIEFGCQYCKATFKKESFCSKHEKKCKILNTLKQEEEP